MAREKILLTAISFGYGPISKICNIARALSSAGYECVFVGSGLAFEYCERECVVRTIQCDCSSKEGMKILLRIAKRCSSAVCCMFPEVVAALSGILPIVYVDSLVWMWDRTHFERFPELMDVDRYVVQRTFDAESALQKWMIRNPVMVGAIIQHPVPVWSAIRSTSKLILHLGGCQNPYSDPKSIQYPNAVVSALSQNGTFERFSTVVVVSGAGVAKSLSDKFNSLPISFVSLSRRAFLEELMSCDVLLTSPGLTMMLEAFAMGIPTIFLPPQNYSQYLLLHFAKEKGLTRCAPIWEFLKCIDSFPIPCSEDRGVQEVHKAICQFSASIVAQISLAQIIERQLNDVMELLPVHRSFINDVGVRGVDDVISVVSALIRFSNSNSAGTLRKAKS